ncbi:MAG: vitamin B12 dependent methionine synthase [Clostridiaceae bacterium]|nr:vitamin B12 dependent methionine synthase [Clostridiaceae bacterium]
MSNFCKGADCMIETMLDDIPFEITDSQFLSAIKIPEDSSEADEAIRLLKEACYIARPKAIYIEAYVESRTEDAIVIDGKTFNSRLLSTKTKSTHRLFPYIATCGVEIEQWAGGITDPLKAYFADMIMQLALKSAVNGLVKHLTEKRLRGELSCMNPGALEDWPISEQKKLFSLFADTAGVKLTDSFLMIPVKSSSGIYFTSDKKFENCELCPRENCPSRRAAYRPDV